MSLINPSNEGDIIEPDPIASADDWSKYPAETTVDLENNNIINGGTITASQFIGAVDISGDVVLQDISCNDISCNNLTTNGTLTKLETTGTEIYGKQWLKLNETSYLAISQNTSQIFLEPSGNQVISFPKTQTTNPGVIVDPNQNFGYTLKSFGLTEIDASLNITLADNSEVKPLKLFNGTTSRSNPCNPVSLTFNNAITNTGTSANVYENAKILFRDASGGDNDANGHLGFYVSYETSAGAGNGDLSEAFFIEGRTSNTSRTRVNGTFSIGESINMGAVNGNLDNATTEGTIAIGTDNILRNETSPFSQQITGYQSIDYKGNNSTRYYRITNGDMSFNFFDPDPPSGDISIMPVEHTILINYDNNIVGADIDFWIKDSSGNIDTNWDFVYITPTTRGQASNFKFSFSPGLNQFYKISVKSIGNKTIEGVVYLVEIT